MNSNTTITWASADDADFFKAEKAGKSDASAYASLNSAWKAAMAEMDPTEWAKNSCCDSFGDY